MSETKVKIRLKFGQFEIDYEGPTSFLQSDLSTLMEKVTTFCKNHSGASTTDPPPSPEEATEPNNKNAGIDLSINAIASRMEKNNASSLVLAACAYLTFVKQKPTFSRKDIMDEMKNATSYFKKSMLGGNLTRTLERLLKDQDLIQSSSNNYALGAAKKAEMEKLLA